MKQTQYDLAPVFLDVKIKEHARFWAEANKHVEETEELLYILNRECGQTPVMAAKKAGYKDFKMMSEKLENDKHTQQTARTVRQLIEEYKIELPNEGWSVDKSDECLRTVIDANLLALGTTKNLMIPKPIADTIVACVKELNVLHGLAKKDTKTDTEVVIFGGENGLE